MKLDITIKLVTPSPSLLGCYEGHNVDEISICEYTHLSDSHSFDLGILTALTLKHGEKNLRQTANMKYY